MENNQIAINPARSVPLFPNDTEWKMLKEQATMIVKTGLLPKGVDTPEKAIAIGLKGRELGIPFMQACSHIHIIQGKPTISSELMQALIYKNCPGSKIEYEETSNTKCTITATRPGHRPSTFSYSIDEAKQAGLLGKENWNKYPAAMLRARTIAIVARALFADAIAGCSYTHDEMGAETNEDGHVIEVSAIRKAPGIHPEKPGPNDGIPTPTDDRILFGKYAGRRLNEIDVKELSDYYWFLDDKIKHDEKYKHNPEINLTAAKIGDYLAKVESSSIVDENQGVGT